MTIKTDFIRKLLDVFNKMSDSNVYKLVTLISENIDQINDTLNHIEEWRDINAAKGTTLDLIGENVGQARGATTDEIYRVLIKARIARNSSDGTMDSVINALSHAISAEPSKINIRALYDEGKPAEIIIEGIPLTELNKVGMSAVQFGYIAQKIVASGIKVASIDLTGTFSFSSQNGIVESDSEKGFALLDQTTGGTLGATFDPEEQIDLPI
jgi:hypothetical protein